MNRGFFGGGRGDLFLDGGGIWLHTQQTMSPRQPSLFQLSMLMKDNCVVYRWRMLSRLLTSLLDEALRPIGVTSSQLNILAIVAGMGRATPKDLALYMQMDKSTVTRALGPMVRDGWLHSEPHPGDRRITVLSLTERGERLFRESVPLWERAQDQICATLGHGPRDVDAFVAAALRRSMLPGIGPIPEVPAEAFEKDARERTKKSR